MQKSRPAQHLQTTELFAFFRVIILSPSALIHGNGRACPSLILAIAEFLCYIITVTICIFLARLLSILAIASFLTGSIIPQRAWAGSVAPAAVSMVKMADRSATMASMGCCPRHKQSLPDSQKDCPCVTLCAASCLALLLPGADYAVILSWNSIILASGDDQDRDRMADPPPPRPPRT